MTMRRSGPAVEAAGLTVRYGPSTAVNGVSFAAGAGEIFGLLGPNGAGKTSVIRSLTTIVPVGAGRATVAGHDLSDPMSVRSRIGVLPESNGYPGAQSALSYLRFYGELFGLSRAESAKRANRRLHQLGLGDNQDRIRTFSRGMRQRLGLARALLNEPTVLFLDEPTLGLDPAGRAELLTHLANAAVEDGTCVVLCSHQLDEVEQVCDRVAIMDHGRIVSEGTVAEVIASSGAGGYSKLHLAPGEVAAAYQVLSDSPFVSSLRLDNARPGDIELELVDGHRARTEVLRVLLDAGATPRAIDFEGARLSDAFRALTSTGAAP